MERLTSLNNLFLILSYFSNVDINVVVVAAAAAAAAAVIIILTIMILDLMFNLWKACSSAKEH